MPLTLPPQQFMEMNKGDSSIQEFNTVPLGYQF